MKMSFLQLPEDTSPQARNAFRAVLTFMLGTVAILGFLLYQAFQTSSWQLWLAAGSVSILLVFMLLGLRLSLRNQPERAIWLMFISWLAALAFNSAMVSGLGLVLLISAVTMTILVSGPTLPDKQKPPFIATGVVFGLLAHLVDLFIPTERIAVQGFQVVIYIVLGLCLLILGFAIVRQFRNYSLRTKMITAFVVTVVAAVGIVAFLTNRSLSATLTEQIGSSFAELADAKAIEVGQAVDREFDVLKALAFNKAIQSAAQTDNWLNTLNQTEIEQLDQQWRAADAADNNNDPLVASVLNNSLASDLRQFQEKFPQHVEIFLTNRQGVSIASTNRTSDYYQADEEWWQTAYEEGLFIGQPEYDESSKTIALTMAVPVQGAGSESIVGVLRTTVAFETLTESLVSGLFGKTGHTDIFLPDGQELSLEAGKDGAYEIVMKDAELDVNLLTQSQKPYLELLHSGIPTLASQAVVGAQGDVVEDEIAIANLNWRMLVLQDRAEALQPVESQTRNILFMAIAILIAAVIAAIGLSQVVSGPIVRLNAVAQKVASGDLSAQAKVETGDETGALATTFNTMTIQLRDSIGTLEQRVAERTRNLELAAKVGRAVSQVRDLDDMLRDACELIRKEFDLYYVQVYLTDAHQATLQLQAGTGEVGVQLLERRHHLQLNMGSINGRAALEKRSVVITDTAESTTFRPNALLPDTRSEMAVPLIVAEKAVGVLDMQSSVPGALNEEVLPAFEALAGQLAVAIQNANLVAEALEARAEMEAQARRLVRTGWEEYLDAIHKPEQIGFVFDQKEIIPLEEMEETQLPVDSNRISTPISLTGEALGSLVVEWDEENQAGKTAELVDIVARQVAQQIENLRLVESAERYRFEAEQAARRLTREGWKNYLDTKGNERISYLYDLKEVVPVNGNRKAIENAVSLPLKVRDEAVGNLTVLGLEENDSQALELANAVLERLGTHIEGLRLSEQLEKRAFREQTLRQITSALRGSTNPETILRIAVRELGSVLGRKTIVQVLPSERSKQAETVGDNGNSSDATTGLPESA